MMNLSLGEALTKAGIKGTKTLAQVEREALNVEKKNQEKQEKREKQENKAKNPSPPINDDSPFSKLWNGERSKKFMYHILHSFLPFSKADFVWTWKEDQERKCCMCRHELMSKEDVFNKHKELAEESIKNLKLMVEGKIANAAMETAKTIFKGKLLAVGTETSRSVFCPKCWEDFSNWVVNRTMRGDTELHKIFNKMRANENKSKS